MREIVDELKEKPVDKDEDDKLEQLALSRRDRRRYKRERLQETIRDMTPAEKRKYLLYYYKEKIIITTAILAAVVILGISYYKSSRPVALSYVVVNCADQLSFNVDAITEYTDAIGKTEGYQVKGDTNVQLVRDEYTKEYEQNANSQKYINFETMATADYYDIIFTDMEGAVYCGMMDIFYPIDRYLDADDYEMVKDDIVMLNDMDGQPTEYVINVSDNEYIKSLNLGYDDVYIGFAGDQADNHERVKEFLEYLYR